MGGGLKGVEPDEDGSVKEGDQLLHCILCRCMKAV